MWSFGARSGLSRCVTAVAPRTTRQYATKARLSVKGTRANTFAFSTPAVFGAAGAMPIRFASSIPEREEVQEASKSVSDVLADTVNTYHASVSDATTSFLATAPVEAVEAVTRAAATGEELAAADSMWPADILMRSIEMLHVTSGMPYWAAIAATTLLIRTALLPVSLNTLRAARRMAIIKPEMEVLQKAVTDANTAGDQDRVNAKAEEMKALFQKHNVHPLKLLMGPLVQMPVFISFFLAVRRMSEGWESCKLGGVGPYLDMSVPDHTFVLPLTVASLFLVTLEFGQTEETANANSAKMKNIMRLMGVMTVPISYILPCGVFAYWIPNNLFSLCQGLVMRSKTMRERFDIPEIPDNIARANAEAFGSAAEKPQQTITYQQRPKSKKGGD